MKQKEDYSPLYWAIALFLVIFMIAIAATVGYEIWNFLTKTF